MNEKLAEAADWLFTLSPDARLLVGKTALRIKKNKGITYDAALIEVYEFIMSVSIRQS